MKKVYGLLLALPLMTVSVFAQTTLLSTTQNAQLEARQENKQRESEFLTQEQKLEQLRDELAAKKQSLQTSIDSLSEQFSINEKLIAENEKKLHLESGSLGELFGVVRQVAKELQVETSVGVTSIGHSESLKEIDAIVSAKELPSKSQLYALWRAFEEQIENGTQVSRIKVPFVQPDGVIGSKEVLRLGAFGLVDDTGYLAWSGEERGARAYPVQPEFSPLSNTALAFDKLVAIDPSKGKLLEQLALTPTLQQRIEQGGAIGRVILGILCVGLIIGLIQGAFLFVSRMKINAQLKNTETIGNSALGRVLGVYKYDKSPNVEALELRLYETVLDEQQKLERGLSMLKLLAALSPMLGLLGTVTGMIETFQVITQFGNADPRIMAGGISTALITTVLGLVSAMPLLFLHNVLSSQAESIRTILEKQGVGLVAERAEIALEPA